MNWDEVGAIGQVLGSIAVFVTLGYLAVQIQHARKEVQRNLGKVSIDSAQEILLALATHPSLSAIYVKANATLGVPPSPLIQTLMDRAGLTEEEAGIFNYLQLAWFQHRVHVIPHIDSMIPEPASISRTSVPTSLKAAFEVYRRLIADRRMQSLRIVEPFDPVDDIETCLGT